MFKGFDDSDDFDSDYGDEDDLERDIEDGAMQRRLGRNNSAANFDKGGNLSKKRITSDDYVHQLRVKSARRGRYGVTVPKPFSFEIRDQ